jgi:hypothetical protein
MTLFLGMSGLPSAHTFTTDKWIALNSVMKQYYYYYHHYHYYYYYYHHHHHHHTTTVSNIMPYLSTMFVDSLFIAVAYFSH